MRFFLLYLSSFGCRADPGMFPKIVRINRAIKTIQKVKSRVSKSKIYVDPTIRAILCILIREVTYCDGSIGHGILSRPYGFFLPWESILGALFVEEE